MDALARLLQSGSPAGITGGRTEDVLIGHERRYWTRAATAHGLTFTGHTLGAAVAAAAIWSAADPDEARTVLANLPDLADQPRERLTATIRWLADLYPATDRYWGSVQPDRLAEHLAATTLHDTGPAWLADTAAAASRAQIHHALTVLARAAVHHPALVEALDHLISHQPAKVAPVALTAAIEAEDPAPLTHAVDKVIAKDVDGHFVSAPGG
jgi:hypothetical protein